jgi:hypothetical protein
MRDALAAAAGESTRLLEATEEVCRLRAADAAAGAREDAERTSAEAAAETATYMRRVVELEAATEEVSLKVHHILETLHHTL